MFQEIINFVNKYTLKHKLFYFFIIYYNNIQFIIINSYTPFIIKLLLRNIDKILVRFYFMHLLKCTYILYYNVFSRFSAVKPF